MAAQLRKYYLEFFCKKQIYPWQPGVYVELDKIFVPVTIDIKIPGVRTIKQRLNSYEDIFLDTETCTRFVLSGSPGQGKSTFCAKVAFDWSYNPDASPLKHIKLLFIIQLSLVDHKSTIEEAICSQLLSNDVDPTILGEVIRELGSSLILVFDGIDEAPQDLFDKPDEVDNLVKTLRYRDMKECRVLVTTRPWREREITEIPAYKRLELQKMNKSSVKEFVKKFFNQNEKDFMMVGLRKGLLRHIEENKLLIGTSTPLVVLLICWFWTKTKGERGIPDRITELYDQIVDAMYTSVAHPVKTKVFKTNSNTRNLRKCLRCVHI